MITPSSASPSIAHVALAPEPNDPFAGMNVMHVWRDCVWAARISTTCKLVLLCIGRFMDGEGKRASMNYSQIAHDCNIHPSTAKAIVGKLQDVWFEKVTAGGRLIEGISRENLYHAMTPPSVVNRVREARLKALEEQVGVVLRDPATRQKMARNTSKTGVSERGPDRGGVRRHVHVTLTKE
jgi:hypothetical protein